MISIRYTTVLIFLFTACCMHADSARPDLSGKQVPAPPKIDGSLGDECWKSAATVEQFWSQNDGDAAEKTISYICYDHKAIYVAFYCYDSTPTEIQAEQHNRRGPMETDDKVIFYLDALNAMQLNQYSRFRVSAGGCVDERLASVAIGKSEWQDDWNAAAKIVSDGYIVEMSIPWKMLQYDFRSDHIGVMFSRYIAKTKRNIVSPRVGTNLSPDRWYKWINLTLPADVNTPVYKPYELLTADKNKTSLKAGGNVFYNPTPTSSLELIINPDRSNIEHYVQHVKANAIHRVPANNTAFFKGSTTDLLGLDMFSTSRSSGLSDLNEFNNTDNIMMLRDPTSWTTATQFFGRSSSGGQMHSLKYYNRQKSTDFELMQSSAINGDNAQLIMVEKEFGSKGSISTSAVMSAIDHKKGLTTDISGHLVLYDVGEHRLTAEAMTSKADDGSGNGAGQHVGASINWDAGLGEWKCYYEYKNVDEKYAATATLPIDAAEDDSDRLINRLLPGATGRDSDYESSDAGASIEFQPEKGPIEYWSFKADRSETNTLSTGELYERAWSAEASANHTNGLSLLLSADQTDSSDGDDHTFTYEIGWGNNTLFRSGAIGISSGQQSDGPYKALELSQGWDFGSSLHCKINWSHEEIEPPSPEASTYTKTVATLVYDFPSTKNEQSVIGQIINKGRNTNFYLVYRLKERSGLSLYALYGDPRAKRTEEMFTLKMLQRF